MSESTLPPADLLLRGAACLNVFTGALETRPVAIRDGCLLGFGEYPSRETLDLSGLLLLPGFCDGHLHLESSMLSPAEFARCAVPHGTTAAIADPHEICNVWGVAGARFLLDGTPRELLDLYLTVPSCVPATPLETAGAALGVAEISEMLRWPEVVGLGEVMNFPGVVAGAPDVMAKLAAAQGRPLDGHAPGLSGPALMAYIAAGPDSDHECTSLAEAEEKLALGMWIMARDSSVSRDLAALAPILTGPGRQRCLLVADDLCADDLLRQGHVDELLRRAVARGVPALDAVRAVTLNVAQRFRLDRQGALAPGYRADLVAVEDTRAFRVHTVLKRGRPVVREGALCMSPQVRLPDTPGGGGLRSVAPEAFALPAPVGCSEVRCRVIEARDGQIVTGSATAALPVVAGQVVPDVSRDLLKLAVVERHGAGGGIGLGFVTGFGLRRGALASTVAHDSHNLIVVACDEASLVTAARAALASGGGQVVAVGDEVLAHLPLPLAGLMSDQPAAWVAARTRALREAAASLGAVLSHPFMALSFLALPVIPELKLTDRGLVDVVSFRHVPLFVP